MRRRGRGEQPHLFLLPAFAPNLALITRRGDGGAAPTARPPLPQLPSRSCRRGAAGLDAGPEYFEAQQEQICNYTAQRCSPGLAAGEGTEPPLGAPGEVSLPTPGHRRGLFQPSSLCAARRMRHRRECKPVPGSCTAASHNVAPCSCREVN